MLRYRTENGNTYRVYNRNGFNQIEFFGSKGLEKIGSVSAGIHGDDDFDPTPNPDAHRQIVDKIEEHAGARIVSV